LVFDAEAWGSKRRVGADVPTLHHQRGNSYSPGRASIEGVEKQVLSKIEISETFKNWAIKYLGEKIRMKLFPEKQS